MGPNNSFKPNLLRYTKVMAEKACHDFGSTTQVSLIQALGRSPILSLPDLAYLLKEETSMAKVFVVKQDYQADVKCFKVDHEYQADLLVYVVDQDYKAKTDATWFYATNDYQATTKIYWVSQD